MNRLLYIVLILLLLSTIFLTVDLSCGEDSKSNISGSEEYKNGYRYNIQGWIYLHIEGEPYERGYQHGYLLADEIVDVINRWINVFPQKWSWKVQRLSAYRLFWRKYPDEYKQEIKGIAEGVAARGGKVDGSPIDYKDILTLNEMYEMLSRFRNYAVYPFKLSNNWLYQVINKLRESKKTSSLEVEGSCSAFIATGDSTVDGRIVAAHSTKENAIENYWWHLYIGERWNVILDIEPTQGYRILMSTSPGLIWSDEDFYQNNAGMILMETTLDPLGPWRRWGDPVVVRARKAIQYSNNIDEIVDCFLRKNNGLMANDWLMGDTKTGEIASLELGLRKHNLQRTSNGFLWSVNNVKDNKVRWEINSIFGFGVLGRLLKKDFEPIGKDKKFENLKDQYHGKIDVDIAKKIMATPPICEGMFDCKITDSKLMENFGLWSFMGHVEESDFIANEHPFKKSNPPGYTDLPASGWVQLFALSSPNIYRSGNQRTNKGVQSKLLWEFDTEEGEFGKAIYSSPAIDSDILFTTSWNGKIYALDIKNGKKLWDTHLGWSSTAKPVIVDDKVFVGSNEGLYAIDKKIGRIIWEIDIGSISSKPVFFGNTVYCGSHDENIYAINSENGEVKWAFRTDGEIYSSPALDDNILYIGSNDNYLYAIDIENGKLKWRYETEGPVVSSPLVNHNFLYFGSWDNNFYALDKETGKLEWKFTAGWGIDSSPIIYKDKIYFGCRDNNLYALDSLDGDLKWMFTANAAIQSSPEVYGGSVFFGSDDGYIYAISATDGALIWKNAPDYYIDGIYNYVTRPIVSSPMAYDGRVYFGSTNGKIYCFDAKTFELPEEAISEKIQIPVMTWVFLIVPLLCIILATALYLFCFRRKK